jgi:hypothetical protein
MKVVICAIGSQHCGNGNALPSPLRGGERAAFAEHELRKFIAAVHLSPRERNAVARYDSNFKIARLDSTPLWRPRKAGLRRHDICRQFTQNCLF